MALLNAKAKMENDRGSALFEAIAVLSALLTVIMGVAAVTYIHSANTWLNYHVEQTLYCLSEGQANCKSQLKTQVEQQLPWGKIRSIEVWTLNGSWTVEVKWLWNSKQLTVRRKLDLSDVVASKALR